MNYPNLTFAFIVLIFLNNLINIIIGRSILASGGPLNDYVRCSKIWNVYGSQIHIGQNEGYFDLAVYNFVPNAIQMRKGCTLTMEDDTGVVSHIDSTIIPGGQCWYRPIASGCCECFGCFGARTPESDQACAVLYEQPDCAACNGNRFEVEVEEIMPFFNDRISSIIVKPGCQLYIHNGANFSGHAAVVTGIIEILEADWNDQISSYLCTCTPSDSGSTEILPTSSTIKIPSLSSAITEGVTISTPQPLTNPPTTQQISISTSTSTTVTPEQETIKLSTSTMSTISSSTESTISSSTVSTVSSTISSTEKEEDITPPFYPIY